jgi:hypothetical protein
MHFSKSFFSCHKINSFCKNLKLSPISAKIFTGKIDFFLVGKKEHFHWNVKTEKTDFKKKAREKPIPGPYI